MKSHLLFSVILVVAACGDDGGPGVDGGSDSGPVDGGRDGGRDADGIDGGGDDAGEMDAAGMDGGGTDGGGDAAPRDAGPDASAEIAAARAAADGATDITIAGALVTYVRPVIGDDPAGFFIQDAMTGPALFIAVDPAGLTPMPEAGDEVSFRVTEMGTADDQRRATMIADFMVLSEGNDLAPLVQDLSAATDVVSALDSYESELVVMDGTIVSDFVFGGTGHERAQLDTAGLMGELLLQFRIRSGLRGMLELENTCEVSIGPTPLWRFADRAQPSAWADGDVTVSGCPRPRVVSATATSSTEVRIVFDRFIDMASITAPATQFTFTSGLTASAATVSAREVRVTTGTQSPTTVYTVTVAATVLDTAGGGIDPAANSAMFMGFPMGLGVSSVDYPVIAHGARLIITGAGLTGATAVSVGGTAQTFTVDSGSQITVAALADATPVGMQNLVVTTPTGMTMPFPLTVIHLLIGEIDADQVGTDMDEFIEIQTGIAASVDLRGYVVVLWNGTADTVYDTVGLTGMTAASGLGWVAVPAFTPAPTHNWRGTDIDERIQNGADAVTLYQGIPSDFSTGKVLTTVGLIDALVYDTNDDPDPELIDFFFGAAAPDTIQIDEGLATMGPPPVDNSIQRCSTARLSAMPSTWVVAAPTPGATNTCP